MDGVKMRRTRVPQDKRIECLQYFKGGHGYKFAASRTGLSRYTVRDYLRSYKAGDITWAEREDIYQK